MTIGWTKFNDQLVIKTIKFEKFLENWDSIKNQAESLPFTSDILNLNFLVSRLKSKYGQDWEFPEFRHENFRKKKKGKKNKNKI